MEFWLDAIEVRVLGSLIEKEITTPDYYPLSLNALVNACNQKSSRDPVMQLDEIAVRQALSHLEDLDLAGRVHDSRVIKFEHHARQVLDLRRPEIAALCLLLLRGPQTVGELRNRSDRLYAFEDIASVQSALERLARPQSDPGTKPRPALVTLLPRRPGEKESRYAHLLSGEPATQPAPPEPLQTPTPNEQLRRLESDLSAIQATVDAMLARIAQLEAGASSKDS
ncbi:MAG TPA: YceH family protein [Acidobacteriaceae bacterium]|nr:YceH family protein [Acidobacteriaceae bacterium]